MIDTEPAALSSRELALRWNVHPNTIKSLGDRGELPYFRVGVQRRYWRVEVVRYETRAESANGTE